jgi:hypothetical protein
VLMQINGPNASPRFRRTSSNRQRKKPFASAAVLADDGFVFDILFRTAARSKFGVTREGDSLPCAGDGSLALTSNLGRYGSQAAPAQREGCSAVRGSCQTSRRIVLSGRGLRAGRGDRCSSSR